MKLWNPTSCFALLMAAYIAACYFSPGAMWVLAGYVIGLGVAECSDWRASLAAASLSDQVGRTQ